MSEIIICVPDELKEIVSSKKINWQLVVARKLNEELEEIARIKRIVSKSKLTEKDAEELSDEISISLAKRYEKMFSEG